MPEFDLLSAVSSSYRQVDLTFSNPVEVNATATSVGTYGIDKLQVIAVNVISATVVRLFTSNQTTGTSYSIQVNQALQDTSADNLVINVFTFTGQSPALPYVVSDLEARSWCSGKAILLSWTLPPGMNSVTIGRRLRAWPFDLATDPYDTVVTSTATVTTWLDTGITEPSLLGVAANVGDTSITTSIPVLFGPGDTIRIEDLVVDLTWATPGTGSLAYDILTVTGVTGGGTIVALSGPLTNAYAVNCRVSKSTPLLAQTYYYYFVIVDSTSNPGQFDYTDDSRAFALSIDVYDGKGWFTDEMDRHTLELDATAMATVQGSGTGFLDKWLTIMGCWLNLMRGHFNALSLVGDAANAPFNMMTPLNQSLGIDPEGAAFDFDAERRPLTSLIFVYQQKGTCPGIVETVRMFCKWDAACVELGQNNCDGGPSAMETWDGDSTVEYGSGSSTITQVVTSAEGDALFMDTAQTWVADLFDDGRLRGWIGDIACVATSGTDTLVMTAPTSVALLTGTVTAGTSTFALSNVSLFEPGMSVQFTSLNPSFPGVYPAEILEVESIAAGSITTMTPCVNGYVLGSSVSIGKSIIRAEYVGSSSATAAGQIITDTKAKWVENQWLDRKLLDGNNVLHTITGNTGNTVTVGGAAPATPYAIAHDYALGVNFAARTPILYYQVENGVHADTFEPTFDVEEVGTMYDPFTYLWMGPGAALLGAWGPYDLGVYILGNVPVAVGRASTAVTFTFNLDPAQPPPVADAWTGYFLNPNQNQVQLFEILSNTTTQLTVAGDVSSLVVPDQAYVVLTARDAVKFKRISARLKDEFSHTDIRVHVLFV